MPYIISALTPRSSCDCTIKALVIISHPGMSHGAFGHCQKGGHIDVLFDLLYSGAQNSVSAITLKVLARFLPNWIFGASSSIFRLSSHRGHIDLLFYLLYSGPGMSVGAITLNVLARFLPN